MKTQEANILPLLTSHLVIGLIGTVLIFLFSSRLESAVRLLEKQSSQDGLTQIFNRSYFDAYFQREFLRSRRQKHPLSLLLCDVDFFKSYNDLYGHQVGDQALVKIAGTLSGQLKRPADLVARYGGEEFVVVLPETPLEGALVIAEHLRAAVEAIGIVHSENKVSPVATISIGCWTYTGESIPLEEVLQKADKALYLAKAGGRNSVIAFGR
jgi:diguanylate cyclase (GGDEF)-like protein